jgi:FAD/FMN-containing dehydrogenase
MLSAGGIGNMTPHYGALVDNVTDLDVVTGDGRLVTCSPEHESELFDMVLAGQGQCGVIVRAGLPLMPAPTHVLYHELTYTDLDAYLSDQLRRGAALRLLAVLAPSSRCGFRPPRLGHIWTISCRFPLKRSP